MHSPQVGTWWKIGRSVWYTPHCCADIQWISVEQTGETVRGWPHEMGICKVLHLVRKSSVQQYRLKDSHLESNWQRKIWVSWWIRSWIWSSNEPLWQRNSQQLTELEKTLPTLLGTGETHLEDCVQSSARDMRTCWNVPSKGCEDDCNRNTWYRRRGWENRDWSAGGREASGNLSRCINTWKK